MIYKSKRGHSGTYYAACERCEKKLKHVGSLAQKYCPDCKKVVDREKSRERMRKMRAKRKGKL